MYSTPRDRLAIGGRVIVCGHVTVTIQRGFTNHPLISLFLVSPGPVRFFGTNQDVGKTVDLGIFPAGTELVFGMDDGPPFSPKGEYFIQWYTGPPNRNADRAAHNILVREDPFNQIVGFEDTGDDQDFNDVTFRVTTSIPYALRLTPSDPMTVLPTVMPRVYQDSQGKRRLFPQAKRQEPVLCRVEVASLDGSPVDKVKILVSVASGEGGSGHLAERHKVQRPHGWLVPARTPPASEEETYTAASGADPPSPLSPAPEPASAADDPVPSNDPAGPAQAATLTSRREEPLDGKADSPLLKLLNRPLEPGEPGGDTKDGPLVLDTDGRGVAEFYYLPPEVAGVETITAELAVPACIDSLRQSFTIKRDGFVDLSRVKFPASYVRSRDAHLSPFWVTPPTAEKVRRAALLYVAKQNGDAEVQGILRELAARGYDFPVQPPQNRIAPKEADVFIFSIKC